MNDMTKVIIPKSDQINADDLIAGPITIRIADVAINAGTEQPVAIRFDGDQGKPWKPCKSMSRVLVAAWGPDAKQYVGRSVTLYRDPKVKWGGMEVGGIRISHLSHIDREMIMALTATKGKRAPYSVKPLEVGSAPTNGRAKAEAWLNGYEADLKAATTKEQLAAIHAKADKAVAKLAKEHPDLHERALTLRPPQEDDPFGSADEGPADTDRGELLTLAEAKDQIARQTTVADVNRLVKSLEAAFDDTDASNLRLFASERCEAILREQG